MEPVFHAGDFVVVNRLAYVISAPKVGDVIALKDPRDEKVLIKRITKIDNNRFFVEGDNKKASTDSRKFGMIERHSIVGRVVE